MSKNQSNEFLVCVRLKRGRGTRLLRVAIYSNLEEPDRIAPHQVLEAFVNGVEEGLFGRATATNLALTVKVIPDQRLTADVLTGTFTWLSPQALTVLPNMVRSSVKGAKGLEILEDCPNERLLLVRTLAPDTDDTIQDLDFQLRFEHASKAGVTVRFLDRPSPETAERLDGIFQAWATLLRLGAYPTPSGEPSAGEWLETQVLGPLERSARFDQLVCCHAAYEALFGAIEQLGEEATITHLTISSCAENNNKPGLS